MARRRSLPWLVLGVLLVVGCALAFTVVTLRAGDREPMLAVSEDLPAGHVLTASDLRVVRVAADDSLHLIPAGSKASVTGRAVAVPLRSGNLGFPS